jgi:hypothetical protein
VPDFDNLEQKITTSGEYIYIVWQQRISNSFPEVKDIFFVVSHDEGQTFSDPINISQTGGDSELPQIATSGNNVYVTWREFNIGSGVDILIVISTDNGNLFSQPENVILGSVSTGGPEISVAPS